MLILAAPTSLPLLVFSYSCSVLAVLSSPCFLLSCTLWLFWQEQSFLLSGCSVSLVTHFFQVITWLMNWPDKVRCCCHLQSHVFFLLSPLACIFLDWRYTFSFKYFDTRVFLVFSEELMFSCHAHCDLCRRCCNRHSLSLNYYLFVIRRIKNPSYNTCVHPIQDITHLILYCPVLDSLYR